MKEGVLAVAGNTPFFGDGDESKTLDRAEPFDNGLSLGAFFGGHSRILCEA